MVKGSGTLQRVKNERRESKSRLRKDQGSSYRESLVASKPAQTPKSERRSERRSKSNRHIAAEVRRTEQGTFKSSTESVLFSFKLKEKKEGNPLVEIKLVGKLEGGDGWKRTKTTSTVSTEHTAPGEELVKRTGVRQSELVKAANEPKRGSTSGVKSARKRRQKKVRQNTDHSNSNRKPQ